MDGLRNSVEMLGLSLQDALGPASANPARLAGVGGKKGGLWTGKDADLVIIDSRYRVLVSIIEGRIAQCELPVTGNSPGGKGSGGAGGCLV